MGWPLRKALCRAGIPAAVFFVFLTVRGLLGRGPADSLIDVVAPVAGGILVLWLAVAVFWWMVTRNV